MRFKRTQFKRPLIPVREFAATCEERLARERLEWSVDSSRNLRQQEAELMKLFYDQTLSLLERLKIAESLDAVRDRLMRLFRYPLPPRLSTIRDPGIALGISDREHAREYGEVLDTQVAQVDTQVAPENGESVTQSASVQQSAAE